MLETSLITRCKPKTVRRKKSMFFAIGGQYQTEMRRRILKKFNENLTDISASELYK